MTPTAVGISDENLFLRTLSSDIILTQMPPLQPAKEQKCGLTYAVDQCSYRRAAFR